MSDLEVALKFTLKWEGGKTGDPADPAVKTRLPGEHIHTNYGITQGTYSSWLRSNRHALRPVEGITMPEVLAIYKRDYWNAVSGDDLRFPLNAVLFDYAVNSGSGRAMAAFRAGKRKGFDERKDPTGFARFIIDYRVNFLNRLIEGRFSFNRFKRGWFNRIRELKRLAGY